MKSACLGNKRKTQHACLENKRKTWDDLTDLDDMDIEFDEGW